jgi:hypothetical protein
LFCRDRRSLTAQQRLAFMRALEQFIADLRSARFGVGFAQTRPDRQRSRKSRIH